MVKRLKVTTISSRWGKFKKEDDEASIESFLESLGITVYHCTPLPSDTDDEIEWDAQLNEQIPALEQAQDQLDDGGDGILFPHYLYVVVVRGIPYYVIDVVPLGGEGDDNDSPSLLLVRCDAVH